MIKATELRIGNLVVKSDQIHSDSPQYGQITTVYVDKANVDYHYPLTWYKPIPLTEEWLLKFGFVTKKTMSDTFVAPYPDNYYHIIKLHGIYIFRCAGCSLQRVNYVHQLQNLYFALTGEELTIKQ